MLDQTYYIVDVTDSPLEGHPSLTIRVGVTNGHPDSPDERYLDQTELETLAENLEEVLNNAAERGDPPLNLEKLQ